MKKVKLTSVCRPKQWKSIPISELSDVGYPVYGANGVIGYYDSYNHEQETVIITCRGATCGTVNLTHPRSYVTGNAMCLDNVKDSVDIKYLFYSMQAYDFTKVISGTAQPQITRVGLEKVEITLPSLDVQREIVSILDKINALIEQRRLQLKKLEELVKARFVEMFGDAYSNPRGLPVLEWNDVFNTTTGKLDSNAATENGAYPFFTCSKEALRIDKYAFDQEALLLAGNNAAGKYDVKHYNGRFNTYQRTYVLSLKQEWSYALFKYQLEDKLVYLQQQSLGGLTKYLTMKILGDLTFLLPSMDEQKQFEDFVAQIDKSKATVQKALDETQLLFDSLMQKYFG